MSRYSNLFLALKNWVFLPLIALCLPLLVLLGQEAYSELKLLKSADSDTVQWTLSQVEIEYLDFLLTLERNTEPQTADLAAVRRDFDILYSRVRILSKGELFASTREIEEFSLASESLQDFLDDTIALIDGSDSELQAGVPDLLQQANTMRPVVRSLFIHGLAQFAQQSDAQRSRIFTTLRQLLAILGTILFALGILFLYSRAAKAQSKARGRELERANAHMQTILSTTREAMIVADPQGIVIDLNTAAETTFGYSLAAAKGQCLGDLIVPPELREAHKKGLVRMMQTGESKLVGKGWLRLEAIHANGQRIPVELALQSAPTEEGNVIIGFLRDISQQVKAEEDLKAARDQALAGEKAKANFLAVMSHEIRTPLNGLLGNLTLMSRTQLDPDQTTFAQNMEISGRQLMHHVNSILDIAKFESGKTTVAHSTFHLGHFIQDIVDSQSSHAARNSTTVEWEWLGPALDWVEADETILEQILLNLVGNAIKFTHAGRISIEAEQITTPNSDCNLELRIIDSGIGISDEDQKRIFNDFESGDTTYTRDSGGTGLGLGIAKRMVHLLGGEIGVESTLGEGSVFWVHIPIQSVDEPLYKQEENRGKAADRALSILVAEDVELNVFVARKLLERDGHTITVAKNGQEAMALATQEIFDVVLMDISMPKMDGLQATKAIRSAVQPYRNVPILACSANVLPEETDRFRASGMNGFIGKPLQLSELRGAIQSVLADPDLNSAMGEQDGVEEEPDLASDLMEQDEFDTYLGRFVTEAETLLRALENEPLKTMGFEVITAQCHQIRSTASLFGAVEFSSCLGRIEQAAKHYDAPGCTASISELFGIWAETRPELVSGQGPQ